MIEKHRLIQESFADPGSKVNLFARTPAVIRMNDKEGHVIDAITERTLGFTQKRKRIEKWRRCINK